MKYPYQRVFQSRFDKLLRKVPALGKLLSSLFGLIEVHMLELFRKIDSKYDTITIARVNRFLFRGRWGGKVVPLNKNIDPDNRFLPTEEIIGLVSRSSVVGIANCYCRETQRKYSDHPNCDNPIKTCIHLGFGESLYEIPFRSVNLKKVSKDQIAALLKESDERGLVHQIIYFPSPQFYYVICNCCPCCCVVLEKFLSIGSPQMIKSDFIAQTNEDLCNNCGECEQWCYFNARKIHDCQLSFKSSSCFGCGLCVSKCPNNAIKLIKSRI